MTLTERHTKWVQPLIPDRRPSSHDLRPRNHDKLLLDKTTYLDDREFVTRMLYIDIYWLTIVHVSELCLTFFFYSLLFTLFVISCVWQLFIKEYNEWMNEDNNQITLTVGILTGRKRMDVSRCGRWEDLVDRGRGSGGEWRGKQLSWSCHLGVTPSKLKTQDLSRLRIELHSALQHNK